MFLRHQPPENFSGKTDAESPLKFFTTLMASTKTSNEDTWFAIKIPKFILVTP